MTAQTSSTGTPAPRDPSLSPESVPLAAGPAPSPRGVRRLGAIGVGAGILFAAMTVWEHAAGLESAGAGSGVVDTTISTGFVLAEAGYVALAVGLGRARPGGVRRWAVVFPALIGLAWTVLLAGTLVDMIGWGGSSTDDVVGPIGGLAQVVGLAGLGIGTVLAQRWTGWRRWFPLGFAVVFVGGLFVPAIMGIEPATVTEAVWALGYAGLGLALMAESGRLAGRATGRY